QAVGRKRWALAVEVEEGMCASAKAHRILDHCVGEERNGLGDQKRELIRHWLNVKYPEAAAQGRLPVPQWIPGKADAEFDVLERGIVEERIPQMRGSVWDISKGRKLAGRLPNHRSHLVTKAQIQRQV